MTKGTGKTRKRFEYKTQKLLYKPWLSLIVLPFRTTRLIQITKMLIYNRDEFFLFISKGSTCIMEGSYPALRQVMFDFDIAIIFDVTGGLTTRRSFRGSRGRQTNSATKTQQWKDRYTMYMTRFSLGGGGGREQVLIFKNPRTVIFIKK